MSKSSRTARRAAPPPPPKSNRTNLIIGSVVGALALAGLIYLLFFNTKSGDPNIPDLKGYGRLQGGHSANKQNYAQIPPVGGVHNPNWQNCGIYNAPVQSELAVHSMEHGAVWIAYDPAIGDANAKKLKDLVRLRAYTLLAPYPGLPAPVVASAWGFQVSAQDAGDPQIGKFVERFANGNQALEPGAPCTGSIGKPDE